MNMFKNKQINISELPQVNQVRFESLHTKYRTVVGIRLLIISVFLFLFSIVPYVFQLITNSLPISREILLSFIGVGALLIMWICIISLKGVRLKGYALREYDIIYKTGIINRTQTVVPFNRVQHIVVYEGVLLRMFGLCTIEFFTAGGALGDLKISGITKGEGERLKAYVIQKITTSIKVNEGVEVHIHNEELKSSLDETK